MAESFNQTFTDFSEAIPYTVYHLPTDNMDRSGFLYSAESRLLSALCLTTPPADDDYKTLLANFIVLLIDVQQQGFRPVQSKSIRNFSVSYSGTMAQMSDFYHQYSDLISKYSQCSSRVAMQSNWNQIIYAPDSLQLSGMLPDNPPMLGGAE